jgi:hypothetical protein
LGACFEEHREHAMPNKSNPSRNGYRPVLRPTPQTPEAREKGTLAILHEIEEETGEKGIEYFTDLADIALGLKKSRSN